MPIIEDLKINIQSKNIDQIIQDNQIKIKLSDEKVRRNKEDSINKINISNKMVERVKADSDIHKKIYEEINESDSEIIELTNKIIELELIINKNPEKYKKN